MRACRLSLLSLGLGLGLGLCLGLGLAGSALAAGADAVQPASAPVAAPRPEPKPEPEPEQPLIEGTRETARSTAEWVARRVDGWFGDQPFEAGGSVYDGRLSLSVFKRADQKPDVDLRFDARFKLPNIERNAYLFVGRDDPRDAIRDTPQDRVNQQQLQARPLEDRSFLAGLGFLLPGNVGVRVGVSAHLKPYVQARYTMPWELTPTQTLVLRQTVFLTENDHLGSTTALSHEWRLRRNLHLRWVNAATITQVSRNFEWFSTLGGYRDFGAQRVLGLELLASGNGTQGTGVGRSDLGVLGRYEQPVYRDWLLGELLVGHFWPRAERGSARARAWALGGSLKMRF